MKRREIFSECFLRANNERPWWPSGKVSASRLEGSKCDSAVHVGLLHSKSYIGTKHPVAGVVRKFGEGGAISGIVLVIGPRFKIARSIPK
ncbi:hypothetical protein AVEN_157572-1 [Araneus ventricosus]|uniref:Uncharacterized protein n=1 Tax=Araneus ventricosus TaxID=182803 RepID=A0A4Y2HIX4_ARAVE|nr:hypothetical protein AVEN_157572-1 [Araneus ventricosus]